MKPGRMVLPLASMILAPRGIVHFAAFADRFDAFAFDDDDRVFDGIAAGGVDQRAALNHQRREPLRRRESRLLTSESRTRIGRSGEFESYGAIKLHLICSLRLFSDRVDEAAFFQLIDDR